MELQYVLTSKQNRGVLATKNYQSMFEFIKKNQDTKIRTIDFTGKSKIMSKQLFLKNYYGSEKNKGKLFVLIQIMISSETAISTLISEMKLNTEYKEFKANL